MVRMPRMKRPTSTRSARAALAVGTLALAAVGLASVGCDHGKKPESPSASNFVQGDPCPVSFVGTWVDTNGKEAGQLEVGSNSVTWASLLDGQRVAVPCKADGTRDNNAKGSAGLSKKDGSLVIVADAPDRDSSRISFYALKISKVNDSALLLKGVELSRAILGDSTLREDDRHEHSLVKPVSATTGQEQKPDTAAVPMKEGSREVAVGAFTVAVPSEWRYFTPYETTALRQQFTAQAEQIYQQYTTGGKFPAQSLEIAALHITGNDGALILTCFRIPPQPALFTALREQAKDKAQWGIQHGYIRKYLGLVPLEDDNISGFYVTTIGKGGNVEVTGGLEHKRLKNTLIQISLLCPEAWDQNRATTSLTALIRSLVLAAR
jgi:hypothetical protein